jgi:ABC-type glycerol-3-phosphate transport system permease component
MVDVQNQQAAGALRGRRIGGYVMSTTLDSKVTPAYRAASDAASRNMRRAKKLRQLGHAALVYGTAIPAAIIFLVPFIWMFSTSIKANNEIFVFPPKWIPDVIHFENYSEGLALAPFDLYLRNTLFVTLGNVLGNLISCTLAAYGFARLRARGKNVLFLLMLATLMLPLWVTLIPQYVLFNSFGWGNSFAPLMVPAWFGWPFFIFLLRQFFMTIPKELEEAARLDGASTLGILWHIILPLSKPALATVAVLGFIGNWNNFFTPLIYLRDPDMYTLAIAVQRFRGQFGNLNLNYMMAVSVLVVLPVIAIFFVAQRYLIRGIVMTGLKS